jgi:glucosamine 6-phosphate synthetase-like amidotransferase/phosphosugar isomerase protein
MTEMIAAEPALAERLLHRLADDGSLARLATAVRDAVSDGAPVMTTGCGTSGHAAMAIARLITEALDLPVGSEARAVPALDAARRPQPRGVLIAVSHEGGTEVTNEALRAAARESATTALVTVGRGSPGAELADIVVATEEQDQSWCHTVGYLSPIVTGLALADRLAGRRTDALAVRALLDVGHDPHAAASVAAALAGTDRIIVIGTGADHGSAAELALKITEGARLAAHAHELETVLHGHLAAATRWTGMVAIMTASDPEPLMVERGRRALEAARRIGVATAGIFDEAVAPQLPEDLTTSGRIVMPHTGRVPGIAGSLLASAMALQVLTERIARVRGIDPDTLGREDAAQAAAHA